MAPDGIKVGDRVEIYDDTVLLSSVEKILGKNIVLIHAPIKAGQWIRLSDEKKYVVLFVAADGMYRYDAEASTHMEPDGYHMIEVRLLSPGIRVQRREFFRFECDIPISFACEGGELGGLIRDIGGGGMRVYANFEMPENSFLQAFIRLGGVPIPITGQILHKQYQPNTLDAYQYRIEFAEISADEQERIIRYIYNQQRMALLKSQEECMP